MSNSGHGFMPIRHACGLVSPLGAIRSDVLCCEKIGMLSISVV
jgi:hypothetical protein